MIEMFAACLFIVIAIASALSLIDGWLQARFVWDMLSEEKALLKAGFVPVSFGAEPKLRTGNRVALSLEAERARHRRRAVPCLPIRRQSCVAA